jgi:ElaB/YqjD/DUF883 family membrane-anchored ribosome-binding protein
MSTEKTQAEGSAPDLEKEFRAIKEEIEALKASLAEKADQIDPKEVRRYLAKEAKQLGFDRDIDLEALRTEGARAARLVRRYPGSTVGLAAAVGFCAGLLAARR